MAATFAPASRKQQMVLESQAQVLVMGGAAGCSSGDTEFFSQHGWKRISDYTPGDKVLQHNPYTRRSELVLPTDYIKLPCDSMWNIQARGLDFTFTDEHRILYQLGLEDSPKVLPFSTVRKRHEASKVKGWTGKIPTTFNYSGPGIDMTEGELRLQVAVMADGRVVKEGKDNYTQMRFSKKRKYDRLIEMCQKYGLRYDDRGSKHNSRYSNGTEYEVIVWPKYPDKSFDLKYYECTNEQFRIILDEVGYWDGTIVDNATTTTIRYFSKHKRDADFIQFVGCTTGRNSTIVHDTREGKESWTVNIMTRGNGFRGLANKDGKVPIVPYKTEDGFKYCFTVPSSFFVIRRNGDICVTGNSGKSYLLTLLPLLIIDDPRTACVMFRRESPQIRGQGGLFDKAKDIYNQLPPAVKPRFKENDLTATFPNGATVKWQSMQHVSDKYNIQGLISGPSYLYR